MRQTYQVTFAALSLAAGLAACSRGNATSAQDDIANDLKLAQASTMNLAQPKVDPALLNASLENKPQGAPSPATTIKRGSGNRAVRSQAPAVHAAPDLEIASSDDSQDASSIQEAPAPDVTEPAAVAPRATPATTVGMGTGSGDYGTSGNGGGIFGPGGGMGGVVMRGGGADGDHCEIHGTGPRRGGPIFVPVTGIPRTSGGQPRAGGSIGTRRAGTTSTVSRPGSSGARGRRG